MGPGPFLASQFDSNDLETKQGQPPPHFMEAENYATMKWSKGLFRGHCDKSPCGLSCPSWSP